MPKIILSRKGFDSSYGGGASPIMPNGDLISIPIPANEKEKGVSYSNLLYKDKSYLQIMKELGIKIPPKGLCHLDPDLLPNLIKREKNWKGIFGQHGAAQTHLENQQIEIGDIFLFFGSFKRTYFSNKLQFERDYERHIIFGYLKIGDIIFPNADFAPIAFEKHPHFQNKKLYAPRNAVYIAKDKESFGTFRFRKELVLTKNGFPKSLWELPSEFHPSKGITISRHSEKDFEIRADKIFFRSRGIGQDFVISQNKEIQKWAKNLISESVKI